MNLIDKIVEHKQFGKGLITKQSQEKITVQFDIGEKIFQYPMAFEQFLVLMDETLSAEISKSIQSKKDEIENENKVKKEKEADHQNESVKVNKPITKIKAKRVKKGVKVIKGENGEDIILHKEN
ncbi:MAG: hypothetical protein CVU84_16885 [Firmicutes bacterium HGW-Firmicutes-1]|jgi:hypothetical protein|nr:MAG: hypothetical protein CVU84_16885 [Firmicutes bacterium HGW-Firmicutes-1]